MSKKSKKKPLYQTAQCNLLLELVGYGKKAKFKLRPIPTKTHPKGRHVTALWLKKKDEPVAEVGDFEVTLNYAGVEADWSGCPGKFEAGITVFVPGTSKSAESEEGLIWYSGTDHAFVFEVDVSNLGQGRTTISLSGIDPRLPDLLVYVDIPSMQP